MPELGPYGSVRGARGNSRPYRESWISSLPRAAFGTKRTFVNLFMWLGAKAFSRAVSTRGVCDHGEEPVGPMICFRPPRCRKTTGICTVRVSPFLLMRFRDSFGHAAFRRAMSKEPASHVALK
jgi:hypothetical protein